MKNIDLSKVKINFNIALWVFVPLLLFLINQASNNFRLKSDISKFRKNNKKEIQKNIEARDKIIERLKSENKNYKIEIDEMLDRIDSLNRVKKKIQIKYVKSVSNIKIMDSKEIKNYWDEEFN
jgi:predicted RNase H-like nuclease (RuvC/YqgF family)